MEDVAKIAFAAMIRIFTLLGSMFFCVSICVLLGEVKKSELFKQWEHLN